MIVSQVRTAGCRSTTRGPLIVVSLWVFACCGVQPLTKLQPLWNISCDKIYATSAA
jgi:hypothetical protein